MPNHVHLLITPPVPVSQLMQFLKEVHGTLRANQILRLTGKPFWQDESYDRLVPNTKTSSESSPTPK